MSSAVVLSSGGINSAVVLEIALRAHAPDPIHMLSFKYESKSNERERLASLDLYNYYRERGDNVSWDQITLPDLFNEERPPYLNTNVIMMTITYAIINNIESVCSGVSYTLLSDFISNYVELKLPLVGMTKAEIIKRALDLEVPANLTWSCSKPTKRKAPYSGLFPCGVCVTCTDRIYGFKKLGYVDPIDYAIEIDFRTAGSWPSAFIGEKQLRAREL